MLLSMGKHRHAVQLLQYHVPPDSLRLARMLLACEELNDPAQAENTRKAIVQAAIDMMMRLHAYNEVVLELLKRGRLMAAMRVVLRHRHRFVRQCIRGEIDFGQFDIFNCRLIPRCNPIDRHTLLLQAKRRRSWFPLRIMIAVGYQDDCGNTLLLEGLLERAGLELLLLDALRQVLVLGLERAQGLDEPRPR